MLRQAVALWLLVLAACATAWAAAPAYTPAVDYQGYWPTPAQYDDTLGCWVAPSPCTISWTYAGTDATDFNVYLYDGDDYALDGNSNPINDVSYGNWPNLSWTTPALKIAHSYTFYIVAVNGDGEGSWTNGTGFVGIHAGPPSSAPTLDYQLDWPTPAVHDDVGGCWVAPSPCIISWTYPGTYETDFHVSLFDCTSGSPVVSDSPFGGSLSLLNWTTPTLEVAHTYLFWVTAANDSGEGPWSTAAGFVAIHSGPPTDAPALTQLGDFDSEGGYFVWVATEQTTQPTIQWGSVDFATKYNLSVFDLTTWEWIVNNMLLTSPYYTPDSEDFFVPYHIYIVYLQPGNDVGWGPWSNSNNVLPMTFVVGADQPPGQPTITSPTGYINELTPAFQWTSVDGAMAHVLSVYDVTDSQTAFYDWVSGSGTAPVSVTAGHSYRASVVAWNDFGWGEWSDWANFTIDTTVPVISGLSPTTGSTLYDTAWWPIIQAEVDDTGSGVDWSSVTFTLDSGQPLAPDLIEPPYIFVVPSIWFAWPPELTLGSHTVIVNAQDLAGNQATPASTTFSYVEDLDGPTITNLSPVDGATVLNATPTISADISQAGSGVDWSTLWVAVDGIQVTPITATPPTGFTYTPAAWLGMGDHTVSVYVCSIAGMPAYVDWQFSIPAGGGDVSISNLTPADGSTNNTLTPTISAHFTQTTGNWSITSLTLDANAITPTPTVSGFTYTPSADLSADVHAVVVWLQDDTTPTPNTAEFWWSFTLVQDSTPPTITALSPADGAYIYDTDIPTIHAYFSDAGSGIDDQSVVFSIGQQAIDSYGTVCEGYGFVYAPLAVGQHSVTVVVYDKAGNPVSQTNTFHVVTTQTPMVVITPMYGSLPLIWLADVYVKDQNQNWTDVTSSCSIAWTGGPAPGHSPEYVVPDSTSAGDYTITATATFNGGGQNWIAAASQDVSVSGSSATGPGSSESTLTDDKDQTVKVTIPADPADYGAITIEIKARIIRPPGDINLTYSPNMSHGVIVKGKAKVKVTIPAKYNEQSKKQATSKVDCPNKTTQTFENGVDKDFEVGGIT